MCVRATGAQEAGATILLAQEAARRGAAETGTGTVGDGRCCPRDSAGRFTLRRGRLALVAAARPVSCRPRSTSSWGGSRGHPAQTAVVEGDGLCGVAE